MGFRVVLTSICLILSPTLGGAAPFDPTTFINATNEVISDLTAFVGLGADLHAYESTKPYSSKVGFDAGVSATAIGIPGKVVKGLTDLGIPNVPRFLPLPKINIQKAINRRLFVGSEFIPSIKVGGNTISLYGFDLQYTLIERPRLPPIAIRGQYNYANLAFIQAATYGGDVLTSFKLLFIDIYGGGGYRLVKGTISNPTVTIPRIPGVNFDATVDAGHFFGGVSLVAGFFRLTGEANFTTRGVNTYGAKLSFFF
ncbi:MAG: hypothetical protein AB1540_05960 [Bdellovibrionota bacterium]